MQQTPGPGDYEIKGEQTQGVTIGARHETKSHDDLPGPGAYIDAASSTKSQIAFTFGEKRDQKIPLTPGPGQYEIAQDD